MLLLLLSILVLAIVALCLWSWYWQNIYLENIYKDFPTIGKPHFLFGHTVQMRKDAQNDELAYQVEYIMKNSKEPFIRVHLLWVPMLVVRDPDILKEALVNLNLHKSRFYPRLALLLGYGLVFSNGQVWDSHRKALMPLFSPTFLKKYIPAFQKHTKQFVDIHAKLGPQPVDLLDELTKLTMDIICDVGFGYELDAKHQSASREPSMIVHAFKDLLGLASSKVFTLIPYSEIYYTWKVRKQKAAIDEVIKKSIEDATANRMTDPDGGQILKFMLQTSLDENGRHFSYEEMRDELMTFFLAGHETTALTLSWALFELSRNPSVLERVQKEIDTVLGDRDLTSDDLPNFKYMTAVLKETLRKYPAAVVFSRSSGKDLVLGGKHIPDYSTLWVAPWTFHRIEQWWPQPDIFDPSRFAEDSTALPHMVSWMPFSLGPRNCIGREFFWIEAKVILSQFLRVFTVEVLPGQKIEPTSLYGTTKPKYGMKVKLIPRKR